MCDFPYMVKNPDRTAYQKRYVPVPCGKCPPCLTRRTNAWQFRLLQHEKTAETASFITLTYDTEHVPISGRGRMTLRKRDFQLFMKRLRKLHPKDVKIRYYAVGEYGSKNWRPHFHAIVYNVDTETIKEAWTCPKCKNPIGSIDIGQVTGASVAYTCKYMHKGKRVPAYAADDRTPEFSLMSKRLGANYLTPQIEAYHQADLSRNYVTLEGGVKVAMPRYYRERLFTPDQRKLQGKEIEKLTKSTLERIEADFDRRTGGANFDRATLEAKKQRIEQFRRRALEIRGKL